VEVIKILSVALKKNKKALNNNVNRNEIIDNLEKHLGYGEDNNNLLIKVAKELLKSDQNYDPKYIAGILGNIICEGTPGLLEGSYYNTKPNEIYCYLQCMKDHFEYAEVFSGNTISVIGVDKTNDLLIKMENKTNPKLEFKSGPSTQCIDDGVIKRKGAPCTPKFGLGMIQWTGSRTKQLIEEYKHYKMVSPDHELYITDYPTIEKCRGIESNFMLLELKDENKEFRKIVKKWEKYKTPYYAGFRICNDYENPAKADQRDFRGKVANDIFKAMKGCCKANKLYCHKKDVSIKSLSYKNITDISNSVNTVDNEACNCDSYDSNTDYDKNLDTQNDDKKHNDDYINDNHHYQDHDQDQKGDDEDDSDSNKKGWILVALGAIWSAIVYVFCCRCF